MPPALQSTPIAGSTDLQSVARFDSVVRWEKVDNNLRDYLRISEAARLLGVSQATLRNWGRQGKLKTHRHPINGYRLFKRADLDDLLLAVRRSGEPGTCS
jgi:excisionase family DNA binding protein